MKNNVFLKYLKPEALKILLLFLGFSIANLILQNIGSHVAYNEREYIIYTSQAATFGLMMCLAYGGSASLIFFNSAMNIKADRTSYLKSCLYSIVLLSVVIGAITLGIDMIYKYIIESMYNKEVVIYSQLSWIFEMEYNDMLGGASYYAPDLSIIRNITNCLLTSVTGFMIGSMLYRFKKKTNIILFIGVPVLIVLTMISIGISNPHIFSNLWMNVIDLIHYFVLNPSVEIIIKAIIFILSFIVGSVLLIKAPVKEYSHDLI